VLGRIRAEARRLGVRRLFLEVEAHNRRAKALYARIGFDDRKRALMSQRL
jgi:ribosomal protein S18 acetylase RimI-like enzyme